MKKKISLLPAAIVALAFCAESAVAAPTSIAEAYHSTGLSESLTVSFTASGGINTKNTYSGPVEILVGGTGWSAGHSINDAFHFTASQSYTGYHYNLWLDGGPVSSKIAFVEGVGAVTGGYVPAYNPTHIYDFVVNISTLKYLNLKVGDGVYGDNGGQFTFTITQLAAGPEVSSVPAPSAFGLMGLGMAGLPILRRRKR